MDLKTVQQQLKDDIAKHQSLMLKLHEDPKNEELRANLREVQKHIAQLGALQKQLGKNKQESKILTKAASAQDSAKFANGLNNEPVGDSFIPTTTFVKLEPDSKISNGFVNIKTSSLHSSSLHVSSEHGTHVEEPFPQPTPTAWSNNSSVSDCNTHQSYLKSEADSVVVAANLAKHFSREMGVISEPLNLSSAPRNYLENPSSSSVSSAHFICGLPTGSINGADSALQTKTSPKTSSKIAFNPPMKVKVPMSNSGGRIMFIPNIIKPSSVSPFVRFASRPQPTLNQKPNSAIPRVWFSVANSASGQNSSRLFPGTIRTNTVQSDSKFQLLGSNFPTVMSVRGSAPKASGPAEVGTSASLLRPAIPTSAAAYASMLSTAAAASAPGKEKLEKQSSVSSTSSNTSEDSIEGKSPVMTNARPYAASPEHLDKQVDFLGSVGLVPREKAERMRNRRYGRRRAVAHPVYSGGLYVSTTGTDTSKRFLPAELLGMGTAMPPFKRPRGRPRGSTNKKNLASRLPLDGANNELHKILRDTKPNVVVSSEPSKQPIEEMCVVCKKPGEMLMCDTCSSLYHVSCVRPPLNKVPSGMWLCEACKKKCEDHAKAPEWPGLLQVVHSFSAFNAQREEALLKVRENLRQQKAQHNKLSDYKKVLLNIIKERVANKNEQKEAFERKMKKCEQLTVLVERIRCAVNKGLEGT